MMLYPDYRRRHQILQSCLDRYYLRKHMYQYLCPRPSRRQALRWHHHRLRLIASKKRVGDCQFCSIFLIPWPITTTPCSYSTTEVCAVLGKFSISDSHIFGKLNGNGTTKTSTTGTIILLRIIAAVGTIASKFDRGCTFRTNYYLLRRTRSCWQNQKSANLTSTLP